MEIKINTVDITATVGRSIRSSETCFVSWLVGFIDVSFALGIIVALSTRKSLREAGERQDETTRPAHPLADTFFERLFQISRRCESAQKMAEMYVFLQGRARCFFCDQQAYNHVLPSSSRLCFAATTATATATAHATSPQADISNKIHPPHPSRANKTKTTRPMQPLNRCNCSPNDVGVLQLLEERDLSDGRGRNAFVLRLQANLLECDDLIRHPILRLCERVGNVAIFREAVRSKQGVLQGGIFPTLSRTSAVEA